MSANPDVDELLVAHAAGRLPEPVSLVVATHLALSPAARERYARYEAVGGALLEGLAPAPLDPASLDRVLARLDEGSGDGRPAEPAAPAAAAPSPRLPRPLRDYLPGPLDSLPWRRYGDGFEYELPLGTPGYRATLIRVRAGGAVPQHTHEGNELTLVIEGAIRDANGRYARGDLAVADASVDHLPTAEPGEDCLCLEVTDAPLRPTGSPDRSFNPFVRF